MILVIVEMMIATTIYAVTRLILSKGNRLTVSALWLVFLILASLCGYFGMPVNRVSTILIANLILLIAFVCADIAVSASVDAILSYHFSMFNNIHDAVDSDSDDDFDVTPRRARDTHLDLTIPVTIATVMGLGCLIGAIDIGVSTNYNVKKSYHSIKVTNVKSKVAPTLHRGQTPVAITPDAVFNKVTKAMSDVPNSNSFEIAQSFGNNEIQAQYWHGKPVYIVPIQFRGFFRYHHLHVIPGYFRISATNPNGEPKFIHKPIMYSDSSYFNHNVDRNIYQAHPGYVALSGNAQLEIDNNGHPYYVETLFKPSPMNNRPNFKHLKIAVEDAETGNVTMYSHLSDTPRFIDENITSDVAESINNYFGSYKHGYWNAKDWGAQTGVKNPTGNGPEDGVTTVFDSKGNINYLSDFTSTTGNTDSALGYSMINARTGHLYYYKTHGIMDTNGAKDNADRNYHAQNFHSEMPVLYDISGHPTWVMSILDDSGLQHGFFFVDGDNPSVHTDPKGTTPNSAIKCLDQFKQALVQNGNKISNSNGSKSAIKHSGRISRCFVSSNGSALFMINNSPTVYTVSTNNYEKAGLMRPNDNVTFKSGANGATGSVTDFTDTNIN